METRKEPLSNNILCHVSSKNYESQSKSSRKFWHGITDGINQSENDRKLENVSLLNEIFELLSI